jgi:hypothetical protein
MGQRDVKPGEIIALAWEAEDRFRAGTSCLARRKLARGRSLSLWPIRIANRRALCLVIEDGKGQDVYDFSDADAAWRAAIGWDGNDEPDGFARYRRRA